jgi:hypothetical protein
MLGILLWGLSGVTHPIMSRLQPKPAVFFPPSQAINLNQALSLPQVLSMHALNNERFERIGLAHIIELFIIHDITRG